MNAQLTDADTQRDRDERWTRWVAKGAAQDRLMNRTLSIVVTLALSGIAAWGILIMLQRTTP